MGKYDLSILEPLTPENILRSLEILKHSWVMYLGIIYFLKATHTWLYFQCIGFFGFTFSQKALRPSQN